MFIDDEIDDDVFDSHSEDDDHLNFELEDKMSLFTEILSDEDDNGVGDEDSIHVNESSSSVSGDGSSSSSSSKYRSLQTKHDLHDVKPDVPEEFKPNELIRFKNVADAIEMYKSYADKAGFNVRQYTERKFDGVTIHKWLVCSRQGDKEKKRNSKDKKRNSAYKRTNCEAKIVIKIVTPSGLYKFEKFSEMHNHDMMDQYELRRYRFLNSCDHDFTLKASSVGIGGSRAFKLRAALRGGYYNINGKQVDYKNFIRDVRCSIGYRDAQLVVNKLNNRKENYPNFSFYKRVDENKVLNALFWVDEAEKAYYSEFGDVLSFDATFRTNKYALVFVPFTVIDHHKSSVTVGAGLLSTEDVGSYKWLLEHFLEAHGNKHPVLVLTDQCPSLKEAVEAIFPNSKHRLCMWHILKKIPNKVGADVIKAKTFTDRFHDIVWDIDIKPDVFEYKWNLLMGEFTFTEKTTNWFKKMYNIRDSWIPAFFNHFKSCGLMKTTSRSESMNAFFNSYSHDENFLVGFIKNYDTAIQRLRYKQRELDHETKFAQYDFKLPLELERNIAKVYTKKLFYEVQAEIDKVWFCEVTNIDIGDGWEIHSINHLNQKHDFVAKYKVELKHADNYIKCTCEHFNRFGLPCRHVLKIMLNKNFKELPEHLILRRWRKNVLSSNYQFSRDPFDDRDAEVQKIVNKIYFNFESSIDMLKDKKEELAAFEKKSEIWMNELKGDSSINLSRKQRAKDVAEKFYGVEITDEVEIHVPNVQSNKGNGKKRLVSEVDKHKGKAKAKKQTRRICGGCGKSDGHNYRTCAVRKLAEKAKEKQF